MRIENGNLAVPVNNTLVCSTSSLAAGTAIFLDYIATQLAS